MAKFFKRATASTSLSLAERIGFSCRQIWQLSGLQMTREKGRGLGSRRSRLKKEEAQLFRCRIAIES
jgi:hypothetical protein